MCYRADKITGPYEKKVILEADFGGFPYVGQGCIVDDAKGNWYGVIFQDRGGVGRVLTLMPCRWVDGWPMLGDADGQVPAVMEKPVQGSPAIPLVVSDDFGDKRMKIHGNGIIIRFTAHGRSKNVPGYLRLKGRTCGGKPVLGTEYLDPAYGRTEMYGKCGYRTFAHERRRCSRVQCF